MRAVHVPLLGLSYTAVLFGKLVNAQVQVPNSGDFEPPIYDVFVSWQPKLPVSPVPMRGFVWLTAISYTLHTSVDLPPNFLSGLFVSHLGDY